MENLHGKAWSCVSSSVVCATGKKKRLKNMADLTFCESGNTLDRVK